MCPIGEKNNLVKDLFQFHIFRKNDWKTHALASC